MPRPPGPAIWARAHLRDLEDRYASLSPGLPWPVAAPGDPDHRDVTAVRRAMPVHRVGRSRYPCRHRRRRAAPGNPAGRASGRMGSAAAACLSRPDCTMDLAGSRDRRRRHAGRRAQVTQRGPAPACHAAAGSGRSGRARQPPAGAVRHVAARQRSDRAHPRQGPGPRGTRLAQDGSRRARTGTGPAARRSGQPPRRPRDLAVRARDSRRTTGSSGQPRRAPAGQRDGRPDPAGLLEEALAVLADFAAEDPAGPSERERHGSTPSPPPVASTFWKRHA